jgi:hypothetical protein
MQKPSTIFIKKRERPPIPAANEEEVSEERQTSPSRSAAANARQATPNVREAAPQCKKGRIQCKGVNIQFKKVFSDDPRPSNKNVKQKPTPNEKPTPEAGLRAILIIGCLKMNPNVWPIEDFKPGQATFMSTYHFQEKRPEYDLLQKSKNSRQGNRNMRLAGIAA